VRDRVADGALRDQHVDARVLGLGEHAHAVGAR
jgi:erythromycin esterase-like protein